MRHFSDRSSQNIYCSNEAHSQGAISRGYVPLEEEGKKSKNRGPPKTIKQTGCKHRREVKRISVGERETPEVQPSSKVAEPSGQLGAENRELGDVRGW